MKLKYILISIIIALLGAVGYLGYKINRMSSAPNRPIMQNRNMTGTAVNPKQGTPKDSSANRTSNGNGPAQSRQNCLADGCLAIDGLNYPAGDLTDKAETALKTALDDEYKAQATYEAIISKLGSIRPFIMIVRAEEQHISSLKAIFDKYGVEIPENSYTGKITAPETLVQACAAGVEAEIANAALYKDRLLPDVIDYEDITLVFTNLMNASQEKHLTAFERCAE